MAAGGAASYVFVRATGGDDPTALLLLNFTVANLHVMLPWRG